ncbi:MAG: glycosyltransferase family 2 protein [Ignavibacteriaceae bacterium]
MEVTENGLVTNQSEISPLVTVNILSFNRKDELRNTLTKVYEQDYKNIEVIVVDNASSDGSPEMVINEFPTVILIRMQKNIGIAGWNEGFKIAKGEYVLVLDDDAYPDYNTIQTGIIIAKGEERIGIVAFEIFNLRYNTIETSFITQPPKMFVGCGALISMKLLSTIGFFSELIFIYNHELDFTARCYNADFKIIFAKTAIVFHLQTPTSRKIGLDNPLTSGFRYYQHFISFSTFLIIHFDYKYVFYYHTKWIINRLIVAAKFSYIYYFLKANHFIILNFRTTLAKRNPLRKEIQKLYEYGNHPLIDRFHFPNFKKPKFL